MPSVGGYYVEEDDFPAPPNTPPPAGGGGGQVGNNLPGGNPGGGAPPVMVPPVVGQAGGGASPNVPVLPGFNFSAPGAPRFNAPVFNRPTLQTAMNEPGYQMRVRAGSDALERSAAARGHLRTGGTLTDLAEYNQNFAEQEYQNVFNRELANFDRTYKSAYDAFAPEYERWRINSGAGRDAALATHGAQLDRWRHDVMGGGGGGGGGYEPDLESLLPALPPIPGYGGGPAGYEVMGQGDPWTDDTLSYF